MITEQEFHIMVEELLYQQESSFCMLCSIARRVLSSSVRGWCAADSALAGGGYEEDIMQEIYARLIKTTVSHFLLRENVKGPYNDDPEGFEDWIFKVARNIKSDYAKQVRRYYMRNLPPEELPGEEEDMGSPEQQERRQKLSAAFEIVLSSDAQVYKALTWVAQCLYVIEYDISRIEANQLIVSTLEQKSLFEMRDIILHTVDRIRWLDISPEQKQRIEDALQKPYDEMRVYGQVTYGEFFMKKGGKKSISDWVNRMNSLIVRVMTHEASNC